MPIKDSQAQFILHLVRCAREKTGDELIEAALVGRELTPQSVFKLAEIAEREFGGDLRMFGHHIGNSDLYDRYHDACLGWLEANGMPSAEKALADRFKPDPSVSILKEFDFD